MKLPHFLNPSANNQFRTIYHEHPSLTSICSILEKDGLSVFDSDEIPTDGCSLNIRSDRPDYIVVLPGTVVMKSCQA